MKQAELRELHEQSVEHLEGELENLQSHLLRQIRMRIAAGEGVNAHEAVTTRRDIARIRTLIREQELGIQGRDEDATKRRLAHGKKLRDAARKKGRR